MEPSPATSLPGWRRKTELDRRRDRRRKWLSRFSPIQPLYMGTIGALGGLLVGLFATITDYPGIDMVILWSLLVAFGFGIPVALLAYLLQLFGWLSRPGRLRIGICSRCFKLTLDGRLESCACGGTFQDSDGWALNRCPRCGYDLRASEARCPECATSLEPGEML